MVSVAERYINTDFTELTEEKRKTTYRPFHSVQLKITNKKVFQGQDNINVEGIVKHLNYSRGEGDLTRIR